MSTPPLVTKTRRGRLYQDPETGMSLPSVTTITGLLNKPALVGWAARQTAEYAVTHHAWMSEQLAGGNRDRVIEALRSAPRRQATRAATRGTTVHRAAEALARGKPVPQQVLAKIDLGCLAALRAFVEDFQPDFLGSEVKVLNRTHRYAGTADCLVRFGASQLAGQTMVGDYKTGGRVYKDVALQLAALYHAEVRLDADGHERPLPALDGAVVIHLAADGYEVRPVQIDGAVWTAFLGLRAAWEFTDTDGFVGATVGAAAGGAAACA